MIWSNKPGRTKIIIVILKKSMIQDSLVELMKFSNMFGMANIYSSEDQEHGKESSATVA